MKISIIIPCYNAANILSRCVNSILKQSFQDWEVLLVNDGSVDSTGDICNRYALLDSRIKVIHKGNGGVSSARNIGMASAHGEYITFIDADDYIEPNYLQCLQSRYHADFVISGFRNNREIDFIPQSLFLTGRTFIENIHSVIEHKYLLYTPWAKLFKRDIIEANHIYFDCNLRYGEDTIFCYEYLLSCTNLEIVASDGYFYDGEWGGGKKYVMTYDEVMYLDSREISLLRQINTRFKSNLDLKYRGYHVSMLSNLYEHYTDIDTYKMYCTTHGIMPMHLFFNERDLSYIFWGLVDLDAKYSYLNRKDYIVYMHKLSHFMTLPTNILYNYSLKMRIVHWNLRHGLFCLNYIILGVLHKWKKQKH